MEEGASGVPAPVEELPEHPFPMEEFDRTSETTDANRDAGHDDKQSTKDNVEEGKELTEEELANLEHDKRKQRREEKRQANLKLKAHYQETESEATQPETDVGPEPEAELEAEPVDQTLTETEAEKELRRTLSVMSHAAREMERVTQTGADEDDIKSPQLSSSDEDDYKRPPLKASFKDDFLENFYFPSLSDISTQSSEVQISQRSTKVPATDMSTVDIGRFVDPLTGEEIPHVEEEPTAVASSQESMEEADEESSSSTISFDWPFPLEDEPIEVVPEFDATEMAMGMLMEVHSPVKVISAQSVTELQAERIGRENRQIVTDFLFAIIGEVVDLAEYVDPNKVLALNLDKNKLIAEVHRVLWSFSAAKQYNTDLHKKMFDYYRRVGQVRSFEPLPTHVDLSEGRRLREMLIYLDYLRSKVAQTKKINNDLMASVTMDLSHVRNKSLFTLNMLEDRIRNTLARKDCEILPRIVESELRRMQTMRNEISDSRIWLITRQHTLGRLIERKRNFDQITPELTMDQFLNAQRDVMALGTKVEERNHELIRMRNRCSKHVNQLAFIREKTSMIAANLNQYRYDLNDKIMTQHELRDEVFELKIQHADLKAQKIELQRKSGLLHKPALLHDFDVTLEAVEAKRQRVKKLRSVIADLEARIAVFEKSLLSNANRILVKKRNTKEEKIQKSH